MDFILSKVNRIKLLIKIETIQKRREKGFGRQDINKRQKESLFRS